MRKWLPLFAACLGTLMLLIDVTIVNVALPEIATDLGTGLSGLQWVVDGYALALAALLLVLGSFADRFGAKPTYLAGLVVFAAASLACGLAGSSDLLVAARAVQGIGGAAMFATTLSLLHATYGGRDRGIAFGAWGAVSGAAAGIGVVLGGVLTDLLSWRWIFLVNLPIAVLTIVLSAFAFGPSPRQPGRSVDVPGMTAFALAATAFTYGVIRAGEHGWSDGTAVTALILGALATGGFALIESRSAAPMFPLALLRNRTLVAALVAATGFNFAAFAASPLISLWLQQQLHLSPLRAGLSMLPMAATAFLVSALFGRFLHDVPPRWTIGGGLVIVGIGSGLLGIIDTGSSWSALLPGYLVIGLGVGVLAPPLVSVAMAAVAPRQSGIAAGAVNTARQLGLALGVAILGTVLRSVTGSGRTTTAHFVSGLDAAVAVAAGAGIICGIAAFALFAPRQPAPHHEAADDRVAVG
ncbi:putative transmembrane efflux protein, major facilitator superfamily [Nocardia nova SH22a]|uniref:Putative transmembrane efflux protein, major facilitator superfamily n=1 Tax=Nocardia nova SH22a TaxID=1415166 RepID=W5TSJ5_9NOCA|nr:MFS transporter [Nocardia nova]AHH20186.1 putative transmembrane efflux protein, major facilitator superfamily [Nocardia nova SH22a]